MNASEPRVLVVDDDEALRELLASVLGFSGFLVETAPSVPAALESIARSAPDAVVLDVMLPEVDGFEMVQLLRTRMPELPVLFLTARDSLDDRVRGLSLGGDDYMVKPFSVVEVDARLRALLRRSATRPGPDALDGLSYDELSIDEDRRLVTRSGEPIALSPTEYRLLHYLMQNSERVLSKSQILEHVWSYDFGGDAGVVERFISNLRRKIDDDRAPLIHTVRGFGYTLRRES